jgi:hypothetical protein
MNYVQFITISSLSAIRKYPEIKQSNFYFFRINEEGIHLQKKGLKIVAIWKELHTMHVMKFVTFFNIVSHTLCTSQNLN